MQNETAIKQKRFRSVGGDGTCKRCHADTHRAACPVLTLKTELNTMQELNINEIEEVAGELLPEGSIGGDTGPN